MMTRPLFVAALDPAYRPLYILAFAAIVALVAWGIVRVVRRTRADNAAWSALQAELGLRQVGEHDWAGDVDGFSLAIETIRKKTRNSSTYEMHVTLEKVSDEVHLGGEGFLTNLLDHGIAGVAGPDIETGDRAFDDAVKVKGDGGAALALLDAETRDVLRRAIKDKWFITRGQVRHVTYGIVSDLRAHVMRGLDLARLVRASSGAVDERLVSRVNDDPVPAVRRRALDRLVARGHVDLPWLFELTGVDHPADVRAGALDAIATHAPEHDHEARARALDLACSWVDDPDVVLRSGGLRAVARAAPPQAEDLLLAALADHHADVQLEAVRGLALVGTVGAVPALAPLRDRVIGSPLTRAAEQAIASIQARVGPAARGGLALAEDNRGGLAVATEPAND